MRQDALQKGRSGLGPDFHQGDVAYGTAITPLNVGMPKILCFLLWKLFSRDIAAFFADHDVAPSYHGSAHLTPRAQTSGCDCCFSARPVILSFAERNT